MFTFPDVYVPSKPFNSSVSNTANSLRPFQQPEWRRRTEPGNENKFNFPSGFQTKTWSRTGPEITPLPLLRSNLRTLVDRGICCCLFKCAAQPCLGLSRRATLAADTMETNCRRSFHHAVRNTRPEGQRGGCLQARCGGPGHYGWLIGVSLRVRLVICGPFSGK